MSPFPSEYGVSPITATPTRRWRGAAVGRIHDVAGANLGLHRRADAGGARDTSPVCPCQVIVQPPHWLPLFWALLPASATFAVLRQRQHVAVVLQHDQRLLHRLARQHPVVSRSDARRRRLIDRARAVEQSHLALHGDDAADGVVEAVHRNGALGDQLPMVD